MTRERDYDLDGTGQYQSDPISQNVATIADIYRSSEERIALHQRLVERLANLLAQPAALFLLLALVIAWMVWNIYADKIGYRPWDPPPFSRLQGLLTLGSLLLSAVILVTQNRQGKTEQRRSHLEFQINLLTEQRTAKIISLLEELRRDLPTVVNRVDEEADALSSPGSPHAIMDALEVRLEELEDSL